MSRRRSLALTVATAALAGGLAAATAGQPTARSGRIETVQHHPSDMVRIPGGPFVRGFPAGDDERGERARELARQACNDAVGAGHTRWCSDQYGEATGAGSIALLYMYPWGNAVPEREIFLPAFDIDRYEVPVATYRRCLAAGRCDSGPLVQGDQRYHGLAESPIGNLTWRDANDVCIFLGKRLPTEAEWEKAARSSDGRQWPWGNQPRTDGGNFGAMESDAIRYTRAMESSRQTSGDDVDFSLAPDARDGSLLVAEPGSLRWSSSHAGAMDMAGNVAEWVADFYSRSGYGDLPDDAPARVVAQEGENRRVVRGGSWMDLPLAGRTYARSAEDPGTRDPRLGVRCAKDAR